MTRAKALFGAGGAAVMQGDTERGVLQLELCLALARELPGHVAGAAVNLPGLAVTYQGDLERATAYLEEALALARCGGDQRITAYALLYLASVARR